MGQGVFGGSFWDGGSALASSLPIQATLALPLPRCLATSSPSRKPCDGQEVELISEENGGAAPEALKGGPTSLTESDGAQG